MCSKCSNLLLLAMLTASLLSIPPGARAQDADPAALSDEEVLARYEAALLRAPFQASAFERVYQAYVTGEGLAVFIKKLEAMPDDPAALVLLGRIHARGFDTPKALDCLTRAQQAGETSPELSALLGELYADAAKLPEAVAAFESALQGELPPERRYELCRALGNVYLRQGDRDKAIATWKLLIETTPDDPFALRDLAEIYTSHLLWPEAAGLYAHLAEVSAQNPYQRCLALRALGDARRGEGKFPEAVAAYEQALDLVTEDNWLANDLSTRLVNAYQDFATLEELMAYLRQRIEAQPANFSWRMLLAQAAVRAGTFEVAAAELNALLERDPARVSAYKLLLQTYRSWEKPDLLHETYERMIKQFPAEPEYLRQLGESWLQAGNPEKAKETWNRLVQDAPAPETWALLAAWLEQYEFPQEAIAAYQQALQTKPEKDWTLSLAALQKDAGNTDEALRLWLSVLDPQSSTAADYEEIALLLRQQDFPEQAEPLLRKAVELAPESQDYAFELARHLMDLEKYDQAVPLFEQLLAAPEKTYLQQRARQGLLQAYEALEILDQKREELRAAVAATPDNIEARSRFAELLVHDGDFPGAIEQYEACVKLAPADNERLQALAQAYERERRFEDALNTYKTLVQQDPSRSGGYHRKLLELYMSRGEEENAIATAQQLVQQTPEDAELRESLATVYQRFQKPDLALQQMRHAIRLQPREAKYYRQLASLLMGQQLWGEAAEAARQMLAVAEQDAVRLEAVRMLGSLYAQQGRQEQLAQEFAARLRATPKKLSAYEELAAIHESFGQPTQGVEIIESALDVVEDRKAVLQSLLGHAENVGNIEKVVSVYDQLIALAGQPTVFDLERLGRAQMALGKTELALTTWKKIPELTPDDPKAHLSHYRLLSEQGFGDEALPSLEKALDLDKFNFQLRYSYAQVLAERDLVPEAIEQLWKILELEPELPADQQQPVAASPGPSAYFPQYMQSGYYPQFAQYGHGYPGRYMGRRGRGLGQRLPGMYPGGPGQTFAQFRPQVLSTLIQFAQQMNQEDEVLKPFIERMTQAPADMRAKEDLLLLYQAVNKQDEAEKIAEALYAQRPEDEQLLGQLVAIYGQRDGQEKAVRLLESYVARGDQQFERYGVQLARFYAQINRKDDHDALMTRLRTQFPENQQVLYALVQNAVSEGDWDRVDALFADLAKLPNQNPRDLRVQFADMARQAGVFDRAQKLLVEVILDTTPQPNRYPRAQTSGIYLYNPDEMAQQSRGGGGLQPLYNPQVSVPHEKLNALSQLKSLNLDTAAFDALVDEHIRGAVEAFLTQPDPAAPIPVEIPKLYFTLLLNDYKLDEARALLDRLKTKGVNDPELDNLDLYLLAAKEQFEVLDKRYAELMPRFPQLLPQIQLARAEVALKRADYDGAEREARALMQDRTVQPRLSAFISHLVNNDQKDRALKFCEDWLQAGNRNTTNLLYAAQMYSNAGNRERAQALAREAWDQVAPTGLLQLQGQSWGGRRGGGQLDQVFQQLLGIYQNGNQTEAFIEELKQRAKDHPESQAYQRFLISAYQMTGRQQDAIAQYEALVAARPNDVDARLQLAQLLMENNRTSDARSIYEELLRTQPRRAREIGHYLVQLVQRAPSEETTELVRQAASQSQDPDALQQLAHSLAQQNKHAEAVEIYQKSLVKNPDYGWLRLNLANSLVALDKAGEAIEALRPMLKANSRFRQYDPNVLQQIVDLYRKAGRLEEITAPPPPESDLDPGYMTMLRARVAQQDARYDEALALLDTLKGQEYEYALVQMRLELAETTKDWPAAIALLEKQFQQQGHVDFDRLAGLYVKSDQPDKAVQLWIRQAEQQGPWGYREALNHMIENKLWPQAEALYREQTSKPQPDQNMRREMDRVVFGAFFSDGQFKAALLDALKTGKQEQMLESMRQAMYDGNVNRGKVPQRFEELLVELPGNPTLLMAYAQVCQENNRPKKALELYTQLVDLDPRNEELRRRYIDSLQSLGMKLEMDALLDKWIADSPTAESTLRLVEVLSYSGNQQAVRRFHDEVLAKLPEEEAAQLVARLAHPLQGAGYGGLALGAMKYRFEAAPGQDAFESYLNMLLELGETDTANTLWSEQHDKYHAPRLTEALSRLLYANGDFDALVDTVWQAAQSGDEYQMRRQAEALVRVAAEFQSAELLNRLLEKAAAESDGNRRLNMFLASLQNELGHADEALAIYDAILKEQPDQPEARQAREQLLATLGRDAAPPQEIGAQGINIWQQRIMQLAGTGKLDEARAMAAELAAKSPGDLNVHPRDYDRTLGQIYLQTQEFDKALPLLDQVYTEQNDSYSASNLAQCYAALKRPAEGLALWKEYGEEGRGGKFQEFARQLVKDGFFAEAIPVLTLLVEIQGEYLLPDLALAIYKTGGDFRAVFTKANAESSYPDNIVYQYAEFLNTQHLVDEMAHVNDLDQDPLLAVALAQCLQHMDSEDPALVAGLLDVLAALDPPQPRISVIVANIHNQKNDYAAALKCYGDILNAPDADENQLHFAARSILDSASDAMIAENLPRLLEKFPEITFESKRVIDLMVKHPDQSAAGRLVRECPALNDTEKRFYLALIQHAAAPSDAAASALRSLAADPALSSWCMKQQARLFIENNWRAEATAALESIAQRSPQDFDRQAALMQCLVLAISGKDYAAGIAFLDRLTPCRLALTSRLRWYLIALLHEEDIPAFREALHKLIRRIPDRVGIEHLVTLSLDLARKLGQDENSKSLCQNLGLAEAGTQKALLWSCLIDDWWIKGPESLPGEAQRMDGSLSAELQGLAQASGGLPDSPGGWKRTYGMSSCGAMNVDSCLDPAREMLPPLGYFESGSGRPGADSSDSDNKVAYFITDIDSPNEREVTFTHGSDDWVCIRLNGEIIRENYVGRDMMVDQDQFAGHLKAGRNRLLVKIGNNRGEWEFALGIVEGGEGLKVVLPETGQQSLGNINPVQALDASGGAQRQELMNSPEHQALRKMHDILKTTSDEQLFPLLPGMLAQHGWVILNDDRALMLLAKWPDRDAARAVIEDSTLPEMFPLRRKFYLALIEYLRAPGKDTGAAMREFAGDESLYAAELDRAARVFLENGWNSEALTCQKARAERLINAEARRKALGKCAEIAVKSREFQVAAHYFSQVIPGNYAGLQEIRAGLMGALAREDIPAFRAALHRAMGEELDHPATEHFVLLSRDLSMLSETPQSVKALCEEFGVAGECARRAREWESLIKDWWVSGPLPLREGLDHMIADITNPYKSTQEAAEILADVPRGWKRTDPAVFCGVLEPGSILGLGSGQHKNKVAYCVTDIESPDERTVKFTHCSDDWVCIRLNGEIIHENYVSRYARMGQDSLEAQLKPGRNRIMLKSGNKSGEWEFALGIVEGGEGLKVVLPEVK